MPIFNGFAGNDMLIGTSIADYISGFAGDDTLEGLEGNDTLYGGDGQDDLIGGAGADRMFGQNGDDYFQMDASIDLEFVDGGAGVDIVHYILSSGVPTVVDFMNSGLNSGAAAGDQLISIEAYQGNDGRDFVSGSDGLNLFYATRGSDRYNGRGGQDAYFAYVPVSLGIPYPVHVTFEVAFGARATTLATLAGIAAPPASSAVAFTEIWDDLNSNSIPEAGEVTRHADVLDSIEYFVGTNGDDRMAGSAADETFSPLTGQNTVNGGAGIDVLSYNFLAASGYSDGLRGATVDLATGTALTSVYGPDSGGIYAFRESTTSVVGIENINGSSFQDQLQGNALANIIAGLDGNDALDGRAGNDELYGGAGMDIVVGGDGNDIVSGGAGADTIDGGAGIDILSYASAETSIAVSLLRGAGVVAIVDGVPIYGSVAEGDVVLNVETVVGSTFADRIVGDDAANTLEGRAGEDILEGCGGNDVIYGERDPLSRLPDFVHEHDLTSPDITDDCECDPNDPEGSHGSDNFNDTITGGDGNDRLYGQLGDDDLCGGNGDDSVYGGDGNDVLDGEANNDVLDGGLGTDIMYGGAGNDRISGGAGFDFIFGGSGTDTVDYSASGSAVTVNFGEFWRNSGGDASSDLLTEIMVNFANGEDATDVLASAVFLSLMTTLGSDGTQTAFTLTVPDVIIGVENIIGSSFADNLTGDALGNVINGGVGADRMTGLDGNDSYIVDNSGDVVTETSATGGIDTVLSSISYTLGSNVENLTLTGTAAINGTGNSLNNFMIGNAAANLLNGGAGADRMIGGNGNDIYLVDSSGDVVTETSATGGIDTVVSAVTYILGSYVEHLTLSGVAAINGFGNTLANNLVGNAAANVLNGGAGADLMIGANGNDTYVVDVAGDVVTESSATGGIDSVLSAIGYTLGANVENLTLTGAAPINGNGNTLANTLVGNAAANGLFGLAGNDSLNGGGGNDRLAGGDGNDALAGGTGADLFSFDRPLNAATNVDTITDFSVVDDGMVLLQSVFSAIGATGPLAAAAFQLGTVANDAGDRIIYDSATGRILYDADGNGAAAAVLFARVGAGTALTNADFTVSTTALSASAPSATAPPQAPAGDVDLGRPGNAGIDRPLSWFGEPASFFGYGNEWKVWPTSAHPDYLM